MSKLLKNSRKKIGQNPGSLIYMGEKKPDGIQITASVYNKNNYHEKNIKSHEELNEFVKDDELLWLNLDGIHNAELIGKIGKQFNIHPLVLEDILNTSHRPKSENLGDYIFIVIKMIGFNKEDKSIKIEQVSLLFNKKYVISFQEDRIDEFQVIRENLKMNKGLLRELGTDYLAYRLLDTVIDNYFAVIENVGDRIENIEDELLVNPSQGTLRDLYKLKSDLILIRRATWPLREAIGGLEKFESSIITGNIKPYLRDIYDHIIQIIDTSENYRDMISGMMDIYLSSINNRLNEVMKILTIISTIFIPLNFIAGVYGMNFNTQRSPFNMPELNWYFGYPMVLSIMFMIGMGLVVYFKIRKWF